MTNVPDLTGLTLVTSVNQKNFSRFNQDTEQLMKSGESRSVGLSRRAMRE